jgi:acylphosphatase
MTVHLLIKGKVQGVFYRATAKEMALKYGITGWIKNTAEGHVEAVCQGDADAIEQFILWCHEGSPRAKVQEVAVTEVSEEPFVEFKVIRGGEV